MIVRRYSIGGIRELRVTRTRGLLFLAVHDLDRCTSGPLAVPEEHFAVFWEAVKQLADEMASRKGGVRRGGANP